MSDSERDGPSSGALRDAESAFQAARQEADRDAERMPAVDFATFILSLFHSARVHLGDAPNPGDGSSGVHLPLARQTIDLLSLLQDKTRGNLSGEEERLLEQALYDLRMRFVEVSRSK